MQQLRKHHLPDERCAPHDDQNATRATYGRRLAELLQPYRGGDALVLALPPGGVRIASEVARSLRLPLGLIVACAFYVSSYPRVLAGAISEGGGLVLNGAAFREPGVTPEAIWQAANQARLEIAAQVAVYRRGRPLPLCHRRPIILINDTMGSGLVPLAAIQSLHRLHPLQYIVAVPHATSQAIERVAHYATVVVVRESDQDAPDDDIECLRIAPSEADVTTLWTPRIAQEPVEEH
jgi:putative phosphoribosyl transferase